MTNAPMATKPQKRAELGDWIFTLALLGVMIAAYVMTFNWPASTAFFPELLSIAGILFLLMKLASLAWTTFGGRAALGGASASKAAHSNGEVALAAEGDEDQGNEDEFHKVFARADRRTWAEVMGWVVMFFGGMYLVGLLVILPVFIIAYLRVVAKAPWRVCIIYVIGTAGVMYAVFELFLHLPLPEGILFSGE